MSIQAKDAHTAAIAEGAHYYLDPESGFVVFTELAHIERGNCCGSECRHCPYNHRNVPANNAPLASVTQAK